MKLYYAPGACSLSPHIVAREADLPFELLKVDTKTHRLTNGDDFYHVNPRGYVPVLELADGTRLREGCAIVQFLADSAPARGLIPVAGTMERVRAQEWLNFIATEFHKQFILLLRGAPEEVLQSQREKVHRVLAEMDGHFESHLHVMPMGFTVVDAYMFAITRWCSLERVAVSLERYAHVASFMRRVAARPAVQESLRAEGLSW